MVEDQKNDAEEDNYDLCSHVELFTKVSEFEILKGCQGWNDHERDC